VPRIIDFCSCIYVFGCKLSPVRLCDSDFGIIPVGDITIRITCVTFCFHIAHISFASSWYLFCLSVIVSARLCVFGTAVSIKKVIHKSYYQVDYYYYFYYIIISLILHWLTVIIVNQYLCRNDTPRMYSDFFLHRNN